MQLTDRLKAWKAEPNEIFYYHAKRALPSHQQPLHRKVGMALERMTSLFRVEGDRPCLPPDLLWVKNEQAQIALVVDNYLPSTINIDQLEFITDNALMTNRESTYRVPPQTTMRLLIDCTPKETGQLQIQG